MTYIQSAFASLTTVGICCCGFMSIPIVIVDYRDKKILKHFYCSPCSPGRLLTVDVICCGLMAAISALMVWVASCILFDYHMAGSAAAFVGAWLLTTLSMFSIGLLAASLCRTAKSLNVATSLLYFPMLLFSGATVPFELFPAGMQQVANFLPLSVGIRLLKAVSMGEMAQRMDIIVLVVITVVCFGGAVKLFRWE